MRRSLAAAVLAGLALMVFGAPAAWAQKPKTAKPKPSPTAKASPTPVSTSGPVATPTPDDSVSDGDLPTVGDDDGKGGDGGGGDDTTTWDDISSGRGMILGLRLGYHAFDLSAGGGVAFEVTGAIPLRGPWYGAVVVGYHTGFHDVNNAVSFFDAEFGAVEGQYRMNFGRLNTYGGLGLGVLSGNSADVVRKNGLAGDSGFGPLAHLVVGAHYPLGRVGLVGHLKYGFAPVQYGKVGETLSMGGLTFGVGVDMGF